MLTVLLSLAVQVTQAPATQRPALSVSVRPANPTVVVGDSIQLAGEVRDSAGRPVPNAHVRWLGAVRRRRRFHGRGASRCRWNVRRLRGADRRRKTVPADARQRPNPSAARGASRAQPRGVEARGGSAVGARRRGVCRERRPPARSRDVGVDAARDRDGLVSRARYRGCAGTGNDSRHRRLGALGDTGGRRRKHDPTRRDHRRRARSAHGDVLRFKAVARDAAGKEIAGLTPSWSIAPAADSSTMRACSSRTSQDSTRSRPASDRPAGM